MRKIREVLRLHSLGLKQRQIARSCSVGQSTVSEYIKAADAAGLRWPDIADWDEAKLLAALTPSVAAVRTRNRYAAPDFASVHAELQQHKHLTLQLVWEEYRTQHPDGYRYSRSCELYQRWRRRQEVVLRQEHRAGEKLFVDYAGATVAVKHPTSGETQEAQLFVAVLGASNYTFAEPTWTQGLGDWIGSPLGQKTRQVCGSDMMDGLHEREELGASAGIRRGASKPEPAAAERISGCREPGIAGTSTCTTTAVQP